MPEPGEATQWDFITLVSWWNLYILPVVIVAVVITLAIRQRARPASAPALDAATTIRRIALIHLALGLRALIQLVQELQTVGTMGILQSNPVSNLITVLQVFINPLLSLGLWRLRSGARRSAIVWYLLGSLIAAWVTYWMWYYHAHVEPADWPDHVVGKAMPWLLLLVMLLPQTRRLFSSRSRSRSAAQPDAGAKATQEEAHPSPTYWSIVSAVVVVLLIVACSAVVVDAADWISRAVTDSELPSPKL
jgi:hypothetical protein